MEGGIIANEASALNSEKRNALVSNLARAPSSFVAKITIPLCMANACDALETMSAAYMLPKLREDFPNDARMITASVFLGMFVGAVIGGPLLLQAGPRRLLVISLFTEALAAGAGSFAHDGIGFAVWRLVAGISIGAGIPALFALAEALMQPEFRRHKLLNSISACWTLGTVLSAGTAWLFFEHYGLNWRQYYAFTGVLPLITALLVQFCVPESPEFLASQGRDDELKQIADQIGAPRESMVSGTMPSVAAFHASAATSQQLAALTQEPWAGSLVKLCIAGFGASFAWYGMGTWLLVVFKDVGVQDTYIAGMVFALSGLPGSFLRHALVGVAPARVLFAGSLAASAICCLVLGKLVSTDDSSNHMHPKIAAAIICTFNTISTSVFNVQVSVWATPFPAKLQPLAIDIQSIAMRVGSIVAQVADGSMLQSHSVLWLALANAGVLLISAVAASKLDVKN